MRATRLFFLAVIAALISQSCNAAEKARFHIVCEGQLKHWQNGSGYGTPSEVTTAKLVAFFNLEDDGDPSDLSAGGNVELRMEPSGRQLSSVYLASAHMNNKDITGSGKGDPGRSYMFDRTTKSITYWGVFGLDRNQSEIYDGTCVVQRDKGLEEYK